MIQAAISDTTMEITCAQVNIATITSGVSQIAVKETTAPPAKMSALKQFSANFSFGP